LLPTTKIISPTGARLKTYKDMLNARQLTELRLLVALVVIHMHHTGCAHLNLLML
jgi:hypothetical protein